MSTDLEFQRGLSLGNMGEVLVCSYLKSRGVGVIPSYDYKGKDGAKAPRLMFETKGLVIPDLDVCKQGKRSWIEVKTYHGPAANKRHGCMVHGIPKRLAREYASVELESGSEVFIAILELESGDLLVSRLAFLASISWDCQCLPCSVGRDECCRSPIKRGVYWPRDRMTHWHTFTPSEINPIRAAKAA